MKKLALNSIIAAIALSAATAFAGLQDFALVNNTEHSVYAVYASPSGATTWENDMLGLGILNPGTTVTFGLNGYWQRFWDIKVVYADNKPDVVLYGVDLFSASAIILNDNILGGTTYAIR